MPSARTIVKHLRELDNYLAGFRHEESIYFERLIGYAFSQILSLPFYNLDTDDTRIKHRVVWQSRSNNGRPCRASGGKPDIIAYCRGFYLIIEATQKTGANQWTQEFAQAFRHCSDFVRNNGLNANEVYIVLAAPAIYEDTYRSLRQHPRCEYQFVPLETSILGPVLDTSALAFTMRNLELRVLLNDVPESMRGSATVEEFRKDLAARVGTWQKDVMEREKGAFIGVKSYEAMRKIPRQVVSVSEIAERLIRHPSVCQYLKIIGEKLDIRDIETCLVGQSLGCRAGRIQTGEALFECVPVVDFKYRSSTLVGAVEEISRRTH